MGKDFGKPLLMATGLCGVFSPHHSPYTIRLSKKTNYPICHTTSILVSLNGSKDIFSEATDFLQLSNALLVMNMNLGNHSEISSQVRNLANVYSIFTAEVEKLDLAGIHVIKLISQEVCHSNIFFKSQTPYHTNL
jgi:hypothetical protein